MPPGANSLKVIVVCPYFWALVPRGEHPGNEQERLRNGERLSPTLAECVTATGVGDVGKAAEGTARRFRWITRHKGGLRSNGTKTYAKDIFY